jgi:hypothetical protein
MFPYAASGVLVRSSSPAPTRQAKYQALERGLYLLRSRLFLLCSRRFQPSTGNVSQQTGTVSTCDRDHSTVQIKLTSRSPTKTSSHVLQQSTDRTPSTPRPPTSFVLLARSDITGSISQQQPYPHGILQLRQLERGFGLCYSPATPALRSCSHQLSRRSIPQKDW